VWGAVLARVLKRPALSAGLAAALLIALAVPAFSISTRAAPRAPALGSSSIHVSQRATSGPGTALV